MTLDEIRPMSFLDKEFFFNRNIGAKLRHLKKKCKTTFDIFGPRQGIFPKKTIFTKLEKKTLKDIMNI
jgi:hypothetical protein